MKKAALVIAAVAALLAVGGATARPVGASHTGGLIRFGSCDAFVEYVIAKTLPLVGPWGFGYGGIPGATNIVGSGAAAAAHPPDLAGTNVQEIGVDEPDIVKAGRSRLFAIARGRIFAVDVSHVRPRLVGSIPLEHGIDQQLLLHGNRLFVIAKAYTDWSWGHTSVAIPHASYLGATPRTIITEVDVRDPSAMRVIGELTLDASYVDARLVGRSARVVLTSPLTPRDLPFVAPTDSSPEAIAAALAQNRAVLKASTAANWLPRYRLTTTGANGSMVGCDQVSRPSAFSGLGLLSVLTLDLEKGLQPVDADGVLANGQTVYASRDGLYVATQAQPEPPPVGVGQVAAPTTPQIPPVTAVHKFATATPDVTDYRASGSVRGTIRDQWSLSEHEGLLRVASTDAGARGLPETFVTVLAERGAELVRLAEVGGLGPRENVYAVRFIGDVGYVVTFRQRDPLFTVDLSNPVAPRVRGKLELLGWSSYLHPLGGDLLLGVGQSADEWGIRNGTQLSIFDVADLRRPARLDHRRLGYTSSEAEVDHHAFLYWPATGVLVVPVGQTGSNRFVGALAFRVEGRQLDDPRRFSAHLQPLARLSHWHNGYRWAVRRSTMIRRTLYTVSEVGVRANDATTLADRGWAGFDDARPSGARRSGLTD